MGLEDHRHDHEFIEDIVDFVLPSLPPYELSVYLLLLRLAHLADGKGEIRIGKRAISRSLGKGTRASSGNYQHITEKLENLAEADYITIGDSTREGTLYRVALPEEVPGVKERMAEAAGAAEEATADYYEDPVLRRELFERDGWTCRYCGDSVDEETATLDHVTPRSKGGSNDPTNLATCCLMCNSIKSGRTYEEAAPQILARIARDRDGTRRSAARAGP